MRIAHLSDLHFRAPSWRLFSKRLLGTLNWLFKRRHHFAHELLDPLPPLFDALGVDLILVTGDLSITGLPAELRKAQEALKKFSQPQLLLPGNHDQYTQSGFRNQTFYKWCANRAAPFTLREHRLEHHKLINGWHLILLDTAPAMPFHFSGGNFSKELEKRLDTLLQELQGPVIVANHFPYFLTPDPHHRLLRGEALAQVLARNRVRLYLHGHTHRHILADLKPSGLPLTLDAGSATYRPRPSFNLLDLGSEAITVTPYCFTTQWQPDSTRILQGAL